MDLNMLNAVSIPVSWRNRACWCVENVSLADVAWSLKFCQPDFMAHGYYSCKKFSLTT